MKEYLDWYKINRKAYQKTKMKSDVHIISKLGDVPVSILTTPRLNKWLQEIATTPPLSSKGNPRSPFAVRINTGKTN